MERYEGAEPRMIFSSYGFRSPVLRKKFAKAIPGGEELKGRTCVVIPFAGYDARGTFDAERDGLAEFGFDPNRVLDVDQVGGNPAFTPDHIYVPGGDPFKLLFQIRSRKLAPVIRKWVLGRGSVYIGVSAGAYVAARSIEYVKQLEDDNVCRDSYGALDLIPEIIVCHSEHYSRSQIKECEAVSGMPAVTIGDGQAVTFEGCTWEYI